jgi:hypothetical protein
MLTRLCSLPTQMAYGFDPSIACLRLNGRDHPEQGVAHRFDANKVEDIAHEQLQRMAPYQKR